MFRQLWIAALISGTCVAAHDTAATWMMNMLTPSPLLISLLSTVASLPFFLFTLPAGALADMVDRKKLLCVVNLWLAAAAAGLAILGWLRLLNPYVILASVHKDLRLCDLCKEPAFGTQRADLKDRSSYNSFAFSMLCRQFLESVLLIGVGFALNAPAWTSSVSEVVQTRSFPRRQHWVVCS
jgi:MFS family permease